MSAVTDPAQQKAPESLARLEGEVPASISQKDSLMVPNTADNVTSPEDWKRELVSSTPGVFRPEEVLDTLRKVHTLGEARAVVEREVPNYPEPENPALPSWANTASPWSWMDGEWQRVVEKADLIRPGRGFTVAVLEYAHADGTITRTSPTLDANLPTSEALSLADATLLSRLASHSATTLATAMSVWKDELVASTDGLVNPEETRAAIEHIDDVSRIEEIVAQGIPAFPMPTVEAPDWADQVDGWEWLGYPDQQWHRRCSRDVDVPDSDGQGISLYSYQYVGVDGVVRALEPIIAADIQIDSVTNVRELAAWFTAAAETIEVAA